MLGVKGRVFASHFGFCSILRFMRTTYFLLLALNLSALGQGPGKPSPADADEFLRKGIADQRHGDMSSAINDYREALKIRPDLVEARANLGAALAATGQFDAAIEEDKSVLSRTPNQVGIRKNLALAYFKKGDCENARTEFAAVHAALPQDLSSAMLLGYCDTKLGKANEAAALLGPMEPGHESNTDFEFALASALMESGKASEGLPRMEKVAQATNSIDAWVTAGSARLHRREFREARVDLDAALKINPSFPGLNTLAGQARDELGDTDAAMSAFEEALRQDPRDFTANLYLGAMLLKRRDLDAARPLLELALQLQPDMPQAQLQMSKLNAMTGRYAEAATALEKLEGADPNWLDPHIELAAIYYKMHRPEDGQREREIVEKIEAQQQKNGPPGP